MNEPTPSTSRVTFSIDWRFIVAILLVVIGVMLYLWKPWQNAAAQKTITVRGEATVKAAPDSFGFQPVFLNADVKAVTVIGNEAVVQLKKLGVADADIKTSVQAADEKRTLDVPASAGGGTTAIAPDYYPYYGKSSYTITLTVPNKELAQKVSDYLATTPATGQVTPSATFAKATRAKLDLQARTEASADAKAKAEAMAGQLGVKVGKVVRISEDGGYGIYATDLPAGAETKPATQSAGPTVQPGTDEVSYSYTVVFSLK